jgi:hypothetical protein
MSWACSSVAFLAYCLQVTLKQRLRSLAPGLTPRSVLDKMAAKIAVTGSSDPLSTKG